MKINDKWRLTLFKHEKSLSYVSDRENDSEVVGMDIDVYGDNKVNDGDEEVDEEENEEGKEQEAGEEEDVDEEADKRYWEAKAKEGVHMVWLVTSENSVGRHTGILMGQELVDVIRKFNFEDKVCLDLSDLYRISGWSNFFFQFGWLVGDNVSVNDVAARYVCKELKPQARKLNAKEIRGRFVTQIDLD